MRTFKYVSEVGYVLYIATGFIFAYQHECCNGKYPLGCTKVKLCVVTSCVQTRALIDLEEQLDYKME